MAKTRKKNEGAPRPADDTAAASRDRDRIALRAYELYLARGGQDGMAMEDWLSAERELLVGSTSASPDRTEES